MESKIKTLIENSNDKCIDYATFMNVALYDVENGYYMKDKQKIGKSGDFYTSSNIHAIFAKVLTKTFIEVLEKENLPPIICEIGAGTGKFAAAVMEELKVKNKKLYDNLTYIIIEGSPYHRQEQQRLIPMDKVVQFRSLDEAKREMSHMEGVIFSNELFDAFPVHVVEQNDELMEVFVTVNESGKLVEIKRTCANEEITSWLKNYFGALAEGQRIEVPLAMTTYLDDLASWLKKGAIYTIDYGYTNEEWRQRQHREGSLRGFAKHKLISNPLTSPSDIDLTTHIHFDALKLAGKENGLENVLFLPQDRFLLQAGILSFLQENNSTDPFSEKSRQNRAINQFISSGGISSSFRVLLQVKNGGYKPSWSFLEDEIQ